MLTWIKLNAEAFHRNLLTFRRHIGKEVRLMPVIKSNAYGHGLLEIARLCDREETVDRLCVASLEEALRLIQVGIRKPIIVVSFFELDEMTVAEALQTGNIAFPIYCLEQAVFLSKIGKNFKKNALVHIKIDVGTSRLGIPPEAAVNFFQKIRALPHLTIVGVFTHFSSSEEDKNTTFKQSNLFHGTLEKLSEAGFNPLLRHSACSASTVLYKETHENAIRPGIGIYGISPSAAVGRALKLFPVLSFHTRIIQTKVVAAGTAIGYGQTYRAPKKMTIATLPIGYYDGFDRGFSNNGSVLIQGVKCPVRGRICMNLTMVEIPQTIASRVKIGEEVVLLGKQKKEEISAYDWALKLDTIPYEVLARLGSHIPRIISF